MNTVNEVTSTKDIVLDVTTMMSGLSNKYIVTGGCGFIGGHLARRLADEGNWVCVVDDQRIGTYELDHPNIVYNNTDVVSFCNTINEEDWKDCTGIIHLANTPRVRRALVFPDEAINNNVTTTSSISKLASNLGCPLYFACSSSTRHSDVTSNAYTFSKHLCEQVLDFYAKAYGLRYINMYFYSVYGPGEADYGIYSTVVRRFKQRMLEHKPLVIYGSGEKQRDFTHVDDVVQSMMQLFVDPDKMEYGEVHFGRNDPKKVIELADAFDNPLGYVHEFDRPGEAQITHCLYPYLAAYNNVLEYITEWRRRHDNYGTIQ